MTVIKATFFTVIAMTCAIGCGLGNNSAPPPDLPETWLSEIIQTVPSDMGSDYLLFANYEAARLEADATNFKGLETFMESGPSSVPWTYAMLPEKGMFTSYSQPARDIIGLDTLGLDQGIWSPMEGTSEPPFSITLGGLKEPKRISIRLGDAGFSITFHRGILYWLFWSDNPPTPQELREHPLGMNLFNLNAIALIEDRLAIARESETLEQLIAVHDGKVPSLRDEAPWRILTQSVGDELLGGALIPPEYVMSPTATGSAFGRSAEHRMEDWKRYADGPVQWGTLEPYNAAIIGYGVPYGVESAIIAMYHSDPNSAERNAAELKKRWESAHLDLRNFSGPDIPFTELCSPLETRVETYAEASILIATCPAIAQPNPTLLGTLGRDFWKALVTYHELHFLAPDLAEFAAR